MSLASKLTYARLSVFHFLLAPVSARARERRMRQFCARMVPKPHDRVLDLGGSADTWAMVKTPLDITVLNLPGHTYPKPVSPPHRVTFVEGDACDLSDYSRGDFDIIFSNSVIEHVGAQERQRAFASQVLKFATKYWVQTPAVWFPIEAHSGMPFWWFYPESWRQGLIGSWRDKLPAWTEMIEGTRVLSKESLQSLFPGGKLLTERVFGIPKSYVVWGDGDQRGAPSAGSLSNASRE
jgi:hypothetical protein